MLYQKNRSAKVQKQIAVIQKQQDMAGKSKAQVRRLHRSSCLDYK